MQIKQLPRDQRDDVMDDVSFHQRISQVSQVITRIVKMSSLYHIGK